MRAGVPWSVKGIEPEAREAAKIAARREGKTLGQWLNEKIFETAAGDDAAPAAAPSSVSQPTAGAGMAAQALQIDFSPVTDALRDLVHRLERSERRSEHVLAGLDETLADMAARLERTERLSGALGDKGSLEQTLADLRARLEKSERELQRTELLNTDAMRTVERGLRAISTRLEETERRAELAIKHAATGPESVRDLKSALDDLARRLDTAETAARTAQEQAAQAVNALNTRGGANDDAVKALERAIGNVVDHIESSDARTSKVIASLQASVEQLSAELAEVKKDTAKPAVSVEAITALEATIAALQKNLSEVTGRVGQLEATTQRDVEQIAKAIEDLGDRLDRVREAAVEAAVASAREAAREAAQEVAKAGQGQAVEMVSALEKRIDATDQRLEATEKQSAEAIRTIESSVTDMAGQMREIANLGGGAGAFADSLSALERAIEEMGAKLQSSDQRSAQALAKVEEISDELMRKLEGPGAAPEIAEVKAALDRMGARLDMVEAGGAAAAAPVAQPAEAWTENLPPPPVADAADNAEPDGAADPFAPPPPPPPPPTAETAADPFGGDAALGAPPLATPGAPDSHASAGDDFLESARRAARAAAGETAGPAGSGTARSPFAEPRRGVIPQLGGARKPLALIAAGLAVVAVAGLVVILAGGNSREVAGPPPGIEIPPDATAGLSEPPAVSITGNTGAASDAADATGDDIDDAARDTGARDTASRDTASRDTGAQDMGTPPGARPPARELPDVVSPAQAARPDATPLSAPGAPTALSPRREVDIAALPEPSRPAARAPAVAPAAPAAPVQPVRRTLREAAADGDPVAQYEIGRRYAAGTSGLPQDAEQAAFWLTRAAEQGLAPAQYRLGTLYEKGQGVPENPTRARSWYERAAAQGNVKALHNLAVMQAEGAGGPQDFAAAARNFEAAAKAGLVDSQYNLAILYERGLGVERDLAKAYQWFSIAAAGGDKDAAARAEALKNSVDAAKLVEAELAARTFTPVRPDPAANEVAWQPEPPAPDAVREAQRLLGRLGYDAGPADGILGGRTIEAVRQFERDRGLAVTGRIDERLLEALKKASG